MFDLNKFLIDHPEAVKLYNYNKIYCKRYYCIYDNVRYRIDGLLLCSQQPMHYGILLRRLNGTAKLVLMDDPLMDYEWLMEMVRETMWEAF